MPLYQVSSGDRILAADIDQFYNLLKGVAASGEAITLIYNGTALIFQPSSDPSAGTRVLDIKNAAGTHLASLDFNGVLELLAAAAAPSGAVAGALYWDTLLSYLRVHDGTNWRELQTVYPNLVLNSDFGRRTVFGLAMPEVFADTSGYQDTNAATVAANVLTFNAVNQVLTWPKTGLGTGFWRDGRFSATFKAVSTTGIYYLHSRVDTNNYVTIRMNNGTLELVKTVAGTPTVVATVANALTVNRWYWLEVEKQGVGTAAGVLIGKLYSTGVTTPGTTKAASTLSQTLSAAVTDAGLNAGADIAIQSDQAAAAWGGIATGNGGVYVETWLPESWAITYTGTLGGQAIGYDEAADSGPINKQWTPVVYIPAVSRTMTIQFSGPDGGMLASTAYDFSYYEKNTGLGGSGVMIRGNVLEQNSASATQATNSQDDAAETSYTRKSATFTTNAATRRFAFQFLINQGGARTGTVRFSLPQVEQGSAATAWRNAPEDGGASMSVELLGRAVSYTTISGTLAEVDSRDLAVNLFMPWDGVLALDANVYASNSGIGNTTILSATIDGVDISTTGGAKQQANVANAPLMLGFTRRKTLAAGKHRIALTFALVTGGTSTLNGTLADQYLRITASRGK